MCDLARSGRPCLLDADQLQQLAEIVETGPDIETDGGVRWRRIDLCRVIKGRFGVDYAERSISTLLAGLQRFAFYLTHRIGFATEAATV